MFYIFLIVFLVCLLITLYFHHKCVCAELEEIKRLILENKNDLIGKEVVIEKNKPKSLLDKFKDSVSTDKPIIKVKTPIEELEILKPIPAPITKEEVKKDFIDMLRPKDDEIENEREDNRENENKDDDDIDEDIRNVVYESITRDDVVDSDVPIIHIPSLHELEQQILNQINSEIKMSEMNSRVEVVEEEDEKDREEEKREDNKSESNKSEENKSEEVKEEQRDEQKEEQKIDEQKSEEVKEEQRDEQRDEQTDDKINIDNLNKIIKQKEAMQKIDEPQQQQSQQQTETDELVINESDVNDIINSNEQKIDKAIINDLLTSDYKYQQLVKKCKEIGIDVQKKKKAEIFDILKSMI